MSKIRNSCSQSWCSQISFWPTPVYSQRIFIFFCSLILSGISLLLIPSMSMWVSKGLNIGVMLSSVHCAPKSAFASKYIHFSFVLIFIAFIIIQAGGSSSWLEAVHTYEEQEVSLPTCRLCKFSILLNFFLISSQAESSPSLIWSPTS